MASDVSPRKSMAMGGGMPSHDTFGVGSMCGEHIPGEKNGGKTLGMGDRAAGKPVKHTAGKLPCQGNPDHGPHMLVGRGSGA